MAEPFRITRTNTKRYVGHCDLCPYTTNVISIRATCALQLRGHVHTEHGIRSGADGLDQYLQPQREGRKMKTPKKELPPLEKLSEYEGHLCVFGAAKVGAVKSQYGTSECDCLVWTYNKGAWKGLGETPIFWQTCGKQILEEIGPDSDTPTETLGGFLRKGGHPERKGDFYWIDIAQDKPDLDLLKSWAKEFSDSF